MRGDKPLMIQTVAGGDVYLGVDLILDGGDADTETGYGGKPGLIHGEVGVRKTHRFWPWRIIHSWKLGYWRELRIWRRTNYPFVSVE